MKRDIKVIIGFTSLLILATLMLASCNKSEEMKLPSGSSGANLISATFTIGESSYSANFRRTADDVDNVVIYLPWAEEFPSEVKVRDFILDDDSKSADGIAKDQTITLDGSYIAAIEIKSLDGTQTRSYTVEFKKSPLESITLAYPTQVTATDSIRTAIAFSRRPDTIVLIRTNLAKATQVKVRALKLREGATGVSLNQWLDIDENNEVSFDITDATGTVCSYKVIYQVNEIVTDFEGNKYNTLNIGKQRWIVQNLKSTKFNDGTPITKNLVSENWINAKEPSYCYYANSAMYIDGGKIWVSGALINIAPNGGMLYNWQAVNSGKLCPEGYHVPSSAEFDVLVKYLAYKGFGYSATDKDVALALAAQSVWNEPGTVNTAQEGSIVIVYEVGSRGKMLKGASGFDAMAGGIRVAYNGTYLDGQGRSSSTCAQSAYIWTKDRIDEQRATIKHLSAFSKWFNTTSAPINSGASVRCLKN